MGNCFNRNTDTFVKDEEVEHTPEGKGEKLNTLMVMAEEEIKTYSGTGGLPNLVSLAEDESKNIKSPEKNSIRSPAKKYEEMLSSPIGSKDADQEKSDSRPEIKITLAAFNPEDTNLFDSDKVHLVMIDEFSEEEVQDEEDSNNNIVLLKRASNNGGFEERLAPLAIADC